MSLGDQQILQWWVELGYKLGSIWLIPRSGMQVKAVSCVGKPGAHCPTLGHYQDLYFPAIHTISSPHPTHFLWGQWAGDISLTSFLQCVLISQEPEAKALMCALKPALSRQKAPESVGVWWTSLQLPATCSLLRHHRNKQFALIESAHKTTAVVSRGVGSRIPINSLSLGKEKNIWWISIKSKFNSLKALFFF